MWFPTALSVAFLVARGAAPVAAQTTLPGVGHNGQGAEIVITNIDANPRPDMIVVAYDAPSGPNTFRYRIGLNLGFDFVAASWMPSSTGFIPVDGVGDDAQGMGAAITNLNNDARPELILMAYDAPAGANTFRYKIGRNLDATGTATGGFTNFVEIDGVGHDAEGADVVATNLDDDVRPELILIAYDAPPGPNSFRYRVARNLNAAGNPASVGPIISVDGVGHSGQGAGAAIANLDADPHPELLVMAYDNPPGPNDFRWRIGWNLGVDGNAVSWEPAPPGFNPRLGVGHDAEGAGLAVGYINQGGQPDLMFVAYDAPSGPNTFRVVTTRHPATPQPIWLEMDRLAGVVWPPSSATRNGVTYTLADILRPVGLAVDARQHGVLTPTLPAGTCYADADLDALLAANRNNPPPPAAGPAWWLYAVFVTCDTGGGLFGLMFDDIDRRGFAMFMNAFSGPGQSERILRTTAHELGHTLCLYHNDGDAWRPDVGGGVPGPLPGQGRTIENITPSLASDWDYAWSAIGMHKLLDRSRLRWQPGSGIPFSTGCF